MNSYEKPQEETPPLKPGVIPYPPGEDGGGRGGGSDDDDCSEKPPTIH